MATVQKFSKFMIALASTLPRFAPKIDDNTLDLWFAAIGQRLTDDELGVIYQQSIERFDQFPSMRELLELAGKAELGDEGKSREVAELIWSAIIRWGSQLKRWPEISMRIGPIGVEVVRLAGGWQNICDVATDENAGTMKAQWRHLAEHMIAKARSGTLDMPPDFGALPEKARTAMTLLLNSVTR